jgi:signal transduction histidine kinase
MTGHELQILFVADGPDPNLARFSTTALDAIVLQGGSDRVVVASAASTRPDVPIVVVADVDDGGALQLIQSGADEVLPLGATTADVGRAVRHARARRVREISSQGAHTVPVEAETSTVPPQIEAMGRLAGGVAQDFNNLLMIVEGNAERLLSALPDDDPHRDRVAAIWAASRRGVALTQKLLAFDRGQPLMPGPTDLNAIVTDCAPLLRGRLGRSIRLVTHLKAGLPQVRADRSQIVQVLIDIARTAAAASSNGGSFTITSDVVVVDAEMRRARPWLTSGTFVRLQFAVMDVGAEDRSRPLVLDPGYSEGGASGDGLHLHSVHRVVEQSGGFMWVENPIGQGARITILLPPLGADERSAAHASPSVPRVLLVEDDDEVRELLIDILNSHGLHVMPVASAEEALGAETRGPVDLLLTDLGLPGASGADLAKELRRRVPRLPVLFISGHTGDVLHGEQALDPPCAFLQKPFSARALVTSLHKLLESRREPVR